MKKECDSCRHGSKNNESGDLCTGRDCHGFIKWEPVEVKRSCDNCMNANSGDDDPCCDCSQQDEWEPKQKVTKTSLTGDSSMSKEQNYEVIVQAVDEDGKIVDSLNMGQPIMVVAEDPQEARDTLNLNNSDDVKALKKKGKVEFIIRPFQAS